MAQFLTVSNSMRAKDRDGNPKVWESQYGTFEVWNVYFQNDDTKYQVNKKEGFGGFTKGQQVYGTLTTSQYGGQFKQEQPPEGSTPPAQSQGQGQKAASPQQPSTGVEAKIDYAISLLENLAQFQGAGSQHTSNDTVPTDIDDGPVNLSELPY